MTEKTRDGRTGSAGSETPLPNPGDEAAPGTPQTGENLCPRCGGSGRVQDGACTTCGGTGRVVSNIGDA
jgi:hypothetical protein